MRKLTVFNSVSLDGYFVDNHGDMSWAHNPVQDEAFNAYVGGNAQGEGTLLLGRITYEMMASYWPTPLAMEQNPVVADGINHQPKFVASRSLSTADWQNTTILQGDLLAAVRALKAMDSPDITILGSGTIIAQLASAALIDEYTIVVVPIALGAGRTLFEGLDSKLNLKLLNARSFGNGNLVLHYAPAA